MYKVEAVQQAAVFGNCPHLGVSGRGREGRGSWGEESGFGGEGSVASRAAPGQPRFFQYFFLDNFREEGGRRRKGGV